MYCISISHKNTPADIRALFALSEEDLLKLFNQVRWNENISGIVCLSTCNRCEIFFTSRDEGSVRCMENYITENKGVSMELLLSHCLVYSGKSAVRHLYKVCAGMDSMVLGEVEILRQVKEAYLYASQYGMTDTELNVIFQGALNSAKTITTETRMTKLPVSIGTLTARKVVSFLNDVKTGDEYAEDKYVLVVGASGKIGNIVVRDIADFNIPGLKIICTGRNHKTLSEKYENIDSVIVCDYKNRYDYVDRADVLISATSSPHYTFTAERVRENLTDTDRKRLFIDLAVPKDIDREVSNIDNTEYVDIDYFKSLAWENNDEKLSEMKKAAMIIDEKVDEALKSLAFTSFRKENEVSMDLLSGKSADWLLYRIRDGLDYDEFEKVLNIIKNEV